MAFLASSSRLMSWACWMICWVGVRSPDLLELPPALPEPFPALFPPQDTRARLREAARTREINRFSCFMFCPPLNNFHKNETSNDISYSTFIIWETETKKQGTNLRFL